MRRQTLSIATTTKSRVSITTTAPVRLHCSVCDRDVDTMSLAEARLLAHLISGEVVLHRILLPNGTARICSDSAVTVDGGAQ